MKIVKRIAGITILISVMLLTFTGCDKDNGSSSKNQMIGTWEMTKTKVETSFGSMEFTATQLGMSQTLVLNSDGTYVMTTEDEDGTETETGKWSTSGNKATITPDDPDESAETVEYEIAGNILTIEFEEEDEEDGVTVTMKITLTFIRK